MIHPVQSQAHELRHHSIFLLFGSWWFKGYHYVFLPFIAFGVAVNFTVTVSLILWKAFRFLWPEKRLPPPATPETLMLIIPCYNETEEELRRSLDSLVEQKGLKGHKRACFIICDGRVRGPGMQQTTADTLLYSILADKAYRVEMKNAYIGWDKKPMSIILQKGTYEGMPYMVIVKTQNQGKRDSLILLRSFGTCCLPLPPLPCADNVNDIASLHFQHQTSETCDYNVPTTFRRNVIFHSRRLRHRPLSLNCRHGCRHRFSSLVHLPSHPGVALSQMLRRLRRCLG